MSDIKYFICSITQEPIVIPGITKIGSIYEYSAIVQWLEENNRDPLTNEILSDKNVLQYKSLAHATQEDVNELEEIATKCANNYSRGTLTRSSFLLLKKSQEEYSKLKLCQDIETNELTQNKQKRFNQFIIGASDAYCLRQISSTLPYNGCNFLDLSNNTIFNGSYKSEDFSFSNLSNCTFVNCDFSRCIFINTNLSNTVFKKCAFIGEEITFYKSIVDSTSFINCRVEYIDQWVSTKEPTEVRKIFESRWMHIVDNTLFKKK